MERASDHTTGPTTVCRSCHHPRPMPYGNGHKTTLAVTGLRAMEINALESGCITCRILSKGFRMVTESFGLAPTQDGGGIVDDERWLRIEFNNMPGTSSLDLFDFITSTAISVFYTTKTLWKTKTLPDLPWGRATLPLSTASDESCAWARRKLQGCLLLHNSCRDARRQQPGGSGRPRRLLHVGSATHDIVRLDDVNDTTPPYICLSHCWGRGIFLRTLTTNIAQRRDGIAWDTLSLTFKEAIQFTRRLGYQHLWVDSLCIIQDDDADWQHESANMASIYQGADLVLSASRASGGSDGLYASLSPTSGGHPKGDFSTYTVEVKTDEDEMESICFRRGFTHLPNITQRRLKSAAGFPTLRRGWIFQERILSTRVLHFGPHELSWECMCETTCQCRDQREQQGDTTLMTPDGLSRTKAYFTPAYWNTLTPQALDRCWHQLVEDYTSLDLTFETDIFPAISGIAKRFQATQPSTYIAGMWESSLLSDMLWTAAPTSGNENTSTTWACRPGAWRAPSWSWAAVKGPIEYINTHNGVNFFCDVVDTNIVLAGSDPTGELRDARLLIKGYMIPAKVQYTELAADQRLHPWNLLKLDILYNHVNNTWIDYNCCLPGEDCVANGSEVECFVVGECVPSGSLLLLIVKRSGQSGSGQYERLGIAQVSKSPRFSGGLSAWLTLLGPPRDDGIIVLL